MDILVVGASGLLGSNMVAATLNRNRSVVGSYHSAPPDFEVTCRELDIRDTEALAKIVDEFSPSTVINCAAMTDVDACERNSKRAHEINATAPKALSRLCSERDMKFVHVSTDYIFDGTSKVRYRERSEPNPIQEYGRSKLAGERGVRSTHQGALVVRLSFVYGVNRSSETPELEGFAAWVHSRLTSKKEVPLYIDQSITPSRAGSTAETILDLAFSGATGRYHVAARSCITPYAFGCIIAAQMGAGTDALVKSSQDNADNDAARPSNTCFSVKKVESQLGQPQPTVKRDVSALGSYF